MLLLKRVLFVVLILPFGGCASLVTTKVTRVHDLPQQEGAPEFVIFQPETGLLDVEPITDRIYAHLCRYGWKAGELGAFGEPWKGDYAVLYGFRRLTKAEVLGSVSPLDETRNGNSRDNLIRSTDAYSGTTSRALVPVANGGGVRQLSANKAPYGYVLTISIEDRRRNLKPTVKITCETTGEGLELRQVLPAMIDSAFAEFPGTSGQTEKYVWRMGR